MEIIIKTCIAGYFLFAPIINSNAVRYEIDKELIVAVIYYESSFRENAENGRHKGLMQVKDGSLNAYVNIREGTSILKYYIEKTGSIIGGLSAYNQGLTGHRKNGINNYAKKVYKLYKLLKNQGVSNGHKQSYANSSRKSCQV